ncbi:MAG: hypothetical protein KFF73_07940 [Cyclobacteriaceae bacterium]|nr:hypothetical protein [Cyclobacteriaceae bacterium]
MNFLKTPGTLFAGVLLLFHLNVLGQEMVPLDIDLPQPMFIGTPQDFDVPNLEKPLGKPRPSFMAPEGTANVSLNKYVESSDNNPIIGKIEVITDGDKEAVDGSFVELAPGKQHITIDLEKKHTLYAIFLWHYHLEARVYRDVIVQVSDDPDFIMGVTTLYNNDHDNSSGMGVGEDLHYVETHEGKLIDARGVEGRYVRFYSNGNSYDRVNHYIEAAVYGKPIP